MARHVAQWVAAIMTHEDSAFTLVLDESEIQSLRALDYEYARRLLAATEYYETQCLLTGTTYQGYLVTMSEPQAWEFANCVHDRRDQGFLPRCAPTLFAKLTSLLERIV